jgi:leucyl/phenylalanyl-tRNA--protein transferase
MLTLLDPDHPTQAFPSVDQALTDPAGLLAVGGCLSQTRLLNAYRLGIFPWYTPEEPILWWSPDPRLVLYPDQFKVSRSLNKKIRKSQWRITFDQNFAEVMDACSKPRTDQNGTWISDEMKVAYLKLNAAGHAHSIEVWHDQQLIGGLYGVSIGQVFFGESMFHHQTDASKIAFASLIEKLRSWHYQLIDCQVHSEHLISLGAEEITRTKFNQLLDQYCQKNPSNSAWHQTP